MTSSKAFDATKTTLIVVSLPTVTSFGVYPTNENTKTSPCSAEIE